MKTKCIKCKKNIVFDNNKQILEKITCDFCESYFFILSCKSCKKKFILTKYPKQKIITCKKCKSKISIKKEEHPVFISYAHEDENWKDQILNHLKFYEDDGLTVWTDRTLIAGDEWSDEIETAINHSKIAILLISIHFFNSSFIKKRELPYIYERYKKGHLTIFPVIVKECPWKKHDFIPKFQVRPLDAIPLEKINKKNLSTELTKIADETKSLLEQQNFQSQSLEDISPNAPNIHLLCNRKEHTIKFSQSFYACMKQENKLPQFYFVHGNENEAHQCLMKRFKYSVIKPKVKTFFKHSKSPELIEIGDWPQKNSLKSQQQRLIFDLIKSVTGSESYIEIDDFEKLVKLPQVQAYKNNIFIISHYLKASEFHTNLIKWYINDFWKKGFTDFINQNSPDETPQFLIFFNVKYDVEKKSFFSSFSKHKAKAKKHLENFYDSLLNDNNNLPADNQNIFLLDELPPITKDDFNAWFIDYKNHLNEKLRLKIIKIFFKNHDTKPMIDVYPFLEKVCIKY